MLKSRIAAAIVLLSAVAWIASGHFGDARTPDVIVEAPPAPLFRVATEPASLVSHRRAITMSGRTQADRRATAATRSSGIVAELNVRRGSRVEIGDVIAVLSDDAREAQVAQARARYAQREAEYEARSRLIESGNLPSLNRAQLEADLKEAQATLAQAEAELRRGAVLAPIAGVVNEVPVEVGQALETAATVAEIIALDPMLAVIEIPERQLGGVRVGDEAEVRLVTGQTARGEVRFISQRASEQTRTYRVEIAIDNADLSISDGVTAEVVLRLAPVPAAEIARSALTFSSDGQLGLRAVGDDGKVAFIPVAVIEDGQERIWVAGLSDRALVIVQGQDFVTEGQAVEAVPAVVASRD
jgi:membrane fusion protein, multidrug efflux system